MSTAPAFVVFSEPSETSKVEASQDSIGSGWRRRLDELLKRWKQMGRVQIDLRGLVYLSAFVALSAVSLAPARGAATPFAAGGGGADFAISYLAAQPGLHIGM